MRRWYFLSEEYALLELCLPKERTPTKLVTPIGLQIKNLPHLRGALGPLGFRTFLGGDYLPEPKSVHRGTLA